MTGMEPLYAFFDSIFGFMFLLPGNPLAGFVIGLFWAALLAAMVGELTMFGAYWINRGHFRKLGSDMVSQHNLSIRALQVQDKASYKACNSEANEAFGKTFFAGIALFASSLWPAFLVMAWLASRFKGFSLPLPLVGKEVGATFFFVPVYIITRIIFHRLKPVLPLFRTLQRKVKENEAGEELMTFADLVENHGSEDTEPGGTDPATKQS